MDFSLTDDQDQMVRAVARWVQRSWAAGDAAAADHRRSCWAELESNGWTGLLTPSSLPLLDAALLVEQLAYGGCSLPVGPGAMVAPLVVAEAGLEPATGTDQLLAVEGRDATAAAAGGVARGLELADRVVVLAATSWQVAAVPVGPVGPVGSGPTAVGSGVVVAQDEGRTVLSRLASPVDPGAWRPIDPARGELIWLSGAVLSAAELVGLARAVLDSCVAYAKERVQGGRPIGGHQAIQHRLADMLGGIERARYQTYQAAVALADPEPHRLGPAAIAVHRAKALAARDCVTAIRSGHQVMGAIAYSAEHDLHHVHKQAIVAASELGDAAHHWAALEQNPA